MTYSHTGTGGEIARLVWHERIADGTTRSVEGPELDPGVWQHVALVRRFSLIGGEIHWYLDGVMQPADGPFVGMIDVGSQDLSLRGLSGRLRQELPWMDGRAAHLIEPALHGGLRASPRSLRARR